MTNTEIFEAIRIECPEFNSHTFCETVRVMMNGDDFIVRVGKRKSKRTVIGTVCFCNDELRKIYIETKEVK